MVLVSFDVMVVVFVGFVVFGKVDVFVVVVSVGGKSVDYCVKFGDILGVIVNCN